MTQMASKERNRFVDLMRDIAMLLVVLQHTMSGCTVGSETSFLFNAAGSLQMPLFVLISGYVITERIVRFTEMLVNDADNIVLGEDKTISNGRTTYYAR